MKFIKQFILSLLLLVASVPSGAQILVNSYSQATGTVLTYKIPSATFPEFGSAKVYNTNGVITTDFDFNAYPNAITGTTGYVDLEAGVNGTGTIGSPFNTMSSVNASSYNKFFIKGKGRNANSKLATSKNIALYQWPSFPVPELTTQTDTDLIWTVNGTNPLVYDATWPSASGFINTVMDRAVNDANGNYTGYNAFTTLANVAAAPGRFWYESGANTLHVRTIDGRVPDNNVIGLVGAGNMFGSSGTANTDRYYYCEGIKFYGGAFGSTITNVGTGTIYFGFYNCEFSHAGGTEAAAYNTARVRGYYRNCKSLYNRNDGFDYNSADGFVFEWYNTAGYNTWTGTTVNGSTSHSSSKVIRVGCNYQYTSGKCMQDIENSKSYNIRCIAGNSNGGSSNDAPYATNSLTGLTEMWLIECQRLNAKGYQNFANSILGVYDGTVGNLQTGTNTNLGTVNTLTQGDVYQ